jgi:hypothetical protein
MVGTSEVVIAAMAMVSLLINYSVIFEGETHTPRNKSLLCESNIFQW